MFITKYCVHSSHHLIQRLTRTSRKPWSRHQSDHGKTSTAATGGRRGLVAVPQATFNVAAPTQTESASSLPQVSRDWRSACIAEIKRGGRPSIHSDSDCHRYEQQLSAHSVGTATAPTPTCRVPLPNAPTVSQAPAPRPAPTAPSLSADECEYEVYGSITYRKCRARVKSRLTQSCRSAQANAESASGASRTRLKARAQKLCQTAERYQIAKRALSGNAQ